MFLLVADPFPLDRCCLSTPISLLTRCDNYARLSHFHLPDYSSNRSTQETLKFSQSPSASTLLCEAPFVWSESILRLETILHKIFALNPISFCPQCPFYLLIITLSQWTYGHLHTMPSSNGVVMFLNCNSGNSSQHPSIA